MTDSKIGCVPFTDAEGQPINIDDVIEQQNFNGEAYTARYKVVTDPEDGELCLQMIQGNERAMLTQGYRAFGHVQNGRLRKGIVIK